MAEIEDGPPIDIPSDGKPPATVTIPLARLRYLEAVIEALHDCYQCRGGVGLPEANERLVRILMRGN